MNRREFVKTGCLACLASGIVPVALSGCTTTRYVSGTIEENGISVLKSDFILQKKNQSVARQFIVVQNEKLAFPIYLFRISEEEYSALWMQCSHQGNELQALGDQLHCPAHGSEFDSKGNVLQGPAAHNLRSFPVIAKGDNIFIDLRAA